MLRRITLPFLLSIVASSSLAEGFCIGDLRDLPLSPDMIAPNALVDQSENSIAQVMCMDCPTFQQMIFYLGEDPSNKEALYRDPNRGPAAVAGICDGSLAHCTADLVQYGPATGVRASYVTVMPVAELTLYTNNQSLKIAVNGGDTDPTWANAILDATIERILPNLLAPCPER